MSLFQAILLGIVQGITEFLPVSSSGHLVIAGSLISSPDVPLLFDVTLHLATLIVVISVFRKRLASLIISAGHLVKRRHHLQDDSRLILPLVSATVITAVIGVLLYRFAAKYISGNPFQVSIFFIFTAFFLLLATLISRHQPGHRHSTLPGRPGLPGVLFMGLAQGLAVLPGVSRAGMTISAGLLCGLNRRAAGEISFLLSIPAVGGAFVLSLVDLGVLLRNVSIGALAGGFLSALVTGYFSLKLLLRLLAGGRLWYFSIYLFVAGLWGIIHFST